MAKTVIEYTTFRLPRELVIQLHETTSTKALQQAMSLHNNQAIFVYLIADIRTRI